MPQPPDGFLFYLTDTLPGQTEFFADFLQCHFLGIDSEKQLNDIPLSLRKGRQSTFHFRGKGFIDQGTVGNGRIVIHQDIVFARISYRLSRLYCCLLLPQTERPQKYGVPTPSAYRPPFPPVNPAYPPTLRGKDDVRSPARNGKRPC